MDPQPKYDHFPWDAIVAALQGSPSPDETLQLQEWLALSPDHRQQFHRLQHLWKDELVDYAVYREADENRAWDRLHRTIDATRSAEPPVEIEPSIEKGAARSFTDAGAISPASLGRTIPMSRWIAVAAIFLLTVGATWWYLYGKNAPIQYETALNERKKISLPDGTTVVLSPQTHLQLAPDFNRSGRTVIIIAGEAYFEVVHQAQLPFMVDMDGVRVKDIGTSFTVQRSKDSIKVTVSGGKVALTKTETGESRELSAGTALCFYLKGQRFGKIKTTGVVRAAGGNVGSLRFDNSSLSDVIAVLQKLSGRKIVLEDPAIAEKRLTINLEKESFDNDLEIICAALNLEYTEKNGVYILKNQGARP
jgi:transmembrane sensor